MSNNTRLQRDLKRYLDAGAWDYNSELDVIWPRDVPEDINGFEVWINEENNTLVIDKFNSEFHIDAWLVNHLDELWDDVTDFPNQ